MIVDAAAIWAYAQSFLSGFGFIVFGAFIDGHWPTPQGWLIAVGTGAMCTGFFARTNPHNRAIIDAAKAKGVIVS